MFQLTYSAISDFKNNIIQTDPLTFNLTTGHTTPQRPYL